MNNFEDNSQKTPEQFVLDNFENEISKLYDVVQVRPEKMDQSIQAITGIMQSPFFKQNNQDLDVEVIASGLRELLAVKDKNEFKKKALEILRPLLDFKLKHPKEFEDMEATHWTEAGGFIPLNERVSYGVYKEVAHFHLAPSRMVKEQLIELFRDGMQKLARIVKEDESIEIITGTSWIVAHEKYGKMLKQVGFEINDVPEEEKKKYFAGEKREVKEASMTREEFLKIFL